MYYIVYKTTNLKNGKIYVGVHKTNNLEDDYLGSGKHLKNAIKKYGQDNFKREILKQFNNIEDAYLHEAEIVTDQFVKRDDTYNIKVGGQGGFDHINNNKHVYTSDYFHGKFKEWWNNLSDDELNYHKEKRSRAGNKNPMYGKTHSAESINKMKHVGDENPNSYNYLKNVKGLNDDEIVKERQKHASLSYWKIISPAGEIYEGLMSLKEFCRKHNISYNSAMAQKNRGKITRKCNLTGWEISNTKNYTI